MAFEVTEEELGGRLVRGETVLNATVRLIHVREGDVSFWIGSARVLEGFPDDEMVTVGFSLRLDDGRVGIARVVGERIDPSIRKDHRFIDFCIYRSSLFK